MTMVGIIAALVTPGIAFTVESAAALEPVARFELRIGDELFVDGPEDGRLAPPVTNPLLDPAFCDSGLQPCYDYELVLVEPAARLRLGFDAPRGGSFQWYLFDPDGEQIATEFPSGISSDIAVDEPAVGTWIFRVVDFAKVDTPFRFRARLETDPAPSPPGQRLLMPNLRMQPPFKFTLETPGGGTHGFDVSEARGIPPTNGCLSSELVEHGAKRCLRFSTGPENVGEGRLQLLFEPGDGGQPLQGRAFQLIDRMDGSVERIEAGEYVYHLEHTHFHHAGFGGFELLRVTDPERGELLPVGTGNKMGWCMANVRIVDWYAFDNEVQPAERENCADLGADPTAEMRTGISRGWADHYDYYTEGMFVDLGDSPDGLYVVRVRANNGGSIHEISMRDNASYALVEISGGDVRLLERGYGEDPWDPHREVVHDWMIPTV